MASLADALFDRLSTITAIGGPTAPRVYRSRLPQPYQLPALTYHRVDTAFEYAHDGDQLVIHPRYQISCWANTNAEAEALARTAQTTLDGWTHTQLNAALPQGQYDVTDPETGVWQVVLDVIVWWKVV